MWPGNTNRLKLSPDAGVSNPGAGDAAAKEQVAGTHTCTYTSPSEQLPMLHIPGNDEVKLLLLQLCTCTNGLPTALPTALQAHFVRIV